MMFEINYVEQNIHLSTVIGTLAREKSTQCQTGIALSALEAPYVKVFVLHAQHLPAALLLTRLTKRFT